ncbi:CvfB family protein [Atopomonas sediminilitoris]|uniref:CvfB family protein n=1 Tax=Atopomonas sediminilitoris TaxID=2919919 RepID=UPI001F4EF321|nr:S1-like domain-containing RNA-binding protein [Atopomonas sediminilitoris]MCJ8168152.1 S1-like domain-containing RNA-binding protein [Atopomonas sediminilitoris]
MADLGRYNRLTIARFAEIGAYLNDGRGNEILLPKRYLPREPEPEQGDALDVFVYLDSEDRPVATTEQAKVQVGEFASLKVVEINNVGLFLDWGLSKDLLLPYSEEKRPLKAGDYCVVYVYLDAHTGRPTATAKLDRYLDQRPGEFKVGQAVDILIAEATDLGYKAVVNNQHWGLLHKNELFKFVRRGMRETAYIREVRPDGKISLTLQQPGRAGADALQTQILDSLAENGGVLMLSDKSTPQEIEQWFKVSKGSFKKAIGGLYKQGKLIIHADRIESVE